MYNTAYTQDLLKRLEKLERFVRGMKVSLVLCVLLIGALLVMGQAPNNQTLRAQRIELSVPGDDSLVEISPNGLMFRRDGRNVSAIYSSDLIFVTPKTGNQFQFHGNGLQFGTADARVSKENRNKVIGWRAKLFCRKKGLVKGFGFWQDSAG